MVAILYQAVIRCMLDLLRRCLAQARLAQLAEQLICNQQVGGSSPSTGTKKNNQLPASVIVSGV